MAHGDALATALGEARRLYENGELAEAQAVLGEALAGVPEGAQDVETVAADRLYAAVLTALGEPQDARPWAARAYATGRDVLGPAHPETLAAAATLAAVLRTLDHPGQAARLYAYLAETLATLQGPRSHTALAARADLAAARYADGDCDRARAMLAEVHALHRDQHGAADAATIKMAALLGRMARDCGDSLAAHEYFDEARTASYRHLGPDDPLTVAVADLTNAPADPGHACGGAPPATSPPERPRGPQPPPAPRQRGRERTGAARPPPVAPYPPRSAKGVGAVRRRRRRSVPRTVLLVLLAILLAVALGLAAVALARGWRPQWTPAAGTGGTTAPITTVVGGVDGPAPYRARSAP